MQIAKNLSTGEIRIHIDSNSEHHIADMAFEVFKTLCKDKPVEKNAVLFHVNFEQKYLTIIGNEGINRCVHQNFWDEMHDYITSEFAKRNYYNALRNSVLKTGEELKNHFPINGENPNELPNEITFF
jgi:uncharacterized membrane protein